MDYSYSLAYLLPLQEKGPFSNSYPLLNPYISLKLTPDNSKANNAG